MQLYLVRDLFVIARFVFIELKKICAAVVRARDDDDDREKSKKSQRNTIRRNRINVFFV